MVSKHKNFKLLTSAAVVTSAIVAPAVASAAPSYFKDVSSSHVAYDSIMYLSGKGIINGFADGTFKPSEKVTRGQAAKILATSLNLDLNNVKNPRFHDVPTTHGFYKYVAALYNAGIIDGYSNGNFGVNDPLSRGQMAKILALAYELEKQPLRSVKFSDVPTNAFYAVYLQSLIDNKITFGVTPTRFAPNQTVDRGQMAMFVHRSMLATKRTDTVNATISTFDGYTLQTDKGFYEIPTSLRYFFSSQNFNALRNATISFEHDKGAITSITTLELKNSGTSSNIITLYGNNTTLNGNLTINADYLNVRDLTVNKNVSFSSGTQNYFTGDTLNIKGSTTLNDYTTPTNRTLNFTFNNSTLNTVHLSKSNTNFTLTNKSFAQSITMKANGTFRTNDTSRVNEVSVEGSVSEVAIYSNNVPKLSVATNRDVTLNGSGAFINVTILTNRLVTLNTSGTISVLDIPRDGYVNVGTQTWVTNVLIPWNTTIRNVIRNYDSAMYRIDRINGALNPDRTPPYAPPAVYDITIRTASMDANGAISMTFDQNPTKYKMTTKTPMYFGDVKSNQTLELTNLSIANGTYTNGQAGTFVWNEGKNQYSTSYSTVATSGNYKTITFYEDIRLRNKVFEITYRVSSLGLEIATDFTDNTVTFLNNTTFSVVGTSGSYTSIAGTKISVPTGTVTNETELQRAISLKVPEIVISRDITITKHVTINYPNVKIQAINGAEIKVSDGFRYRAEEAAITFDENAKNAKLQNVKLVGHSSTRGHGILVNADSVTFDNTEVANFQGFNIVTDNTSLITMNKVKLSNSNKGGLQVYTSKTSTATNVTMTNVETTNNQLGGIHLVADRGNSKVIINGKDNKHNDQYKGVPAPAFWTEGNGAFEFKLADFNLYTKIQNEYYHIDNEVELSHAFTEAIKTKTDKQTPKMNIANNFTLNKSFNFNEAVSINGNGKTITLNSKGDPKKGAEGLLISSTVVIDNLNFTSGKDMKDHLIEVIGNGASLALSNSALQDSTLGAIYVGNSDKKATKEKLTLKGNIVFTNNVVGGVGATDGVTINAIDAKITYAPSKLTNNVVYKRLNQKDSIKVDPIFWADTLDVKFELPKGFNKNEVFRDKNDNKILSNERNPATEVIYSR
ncbi:S-layer homology domain-containing protein [Sporosarcina highlanderae]|uniref:S-layer homology domain-containing protein n=1 Tax=Sporosarcina highlanderae TaxID=3035916 RepID=A0ABT8JUD1_9BACL|nr:S-layer homology domain-containing protein [Sporosarcina highlanderae]MDN4608768.1 S-layer homology domain-containing protein [Sporosarcina highlanderae]